MNPKSNTEWPILEIKCLHCEEVKPIPQKYKCKTSICLDCRRKASKEYSRKKAEKEGKRVGEAGRYPYPLQGWAYMAKKFNTLARELKKTNCRKDAQDLIKRNLENVLENKEVLDWISAHDNLERQYEKEAKRKVKENKKVHIDTRNITWDEWERLGYGQEWDD